jgi:hypothetical protein
MSSEQSSGSFFNERGRRLLTKPYRVFDTEDLDYYYIQNTEVDLAGVLRNFHDAGIGENISLEKFQASLDGLKSRFRSVAPLKNLFNGVHVPFIVPKINDTEKGLSYTIVERLLPSLESSFKRHYPRAHFKAIMQAGSTLSGNLRVDERSRYPNLLDAAKESDLIGWYFPQALQQYDIQSQVMQTEELPNETGLCLSGPLEVLSANIGKPDLLINEAGYAPILTMPAVGHIDERLALALKSYGPHLEFWCLSNELSPGIKQVSEQWAGGISFFTSISKVKIPQ